MARLDVPATEILTSYDRTGGNDDYNNYVRTGPEGWWIIADIEGPGYVTRFWTTGADNGQHRLRIYLDGAREPAMDTTLGEFFGGTPPFTPPLAKLESFGWYSYVPIPFRERLVIMVEEGDTRKDHWPRIFYQINYTRLPDDETIESFTWPPPDRVKQALQEVATAWTDHACPTAASTTTYRGTAMVPSGQIGDALQLEGPAIIHELRLKPDLSKIASAAARRDALHQLRLRIEWDRSGMDSVMVPLGEFFGSFYGPLQYSSMFLGRSTNAFFTRFPMPFRQAASIRLENAGPNTVPVQVRAKVERLSTWDEQWGCFHAGWRSTSPRRIGQPHPVVQTRGRGRLGGCMLSVTSADKSWWVLEGDETIRRDAEEEPGWRGTGLEDYFNGSWYYQNPIATPLNGLLFKVPFRTVQYRMHLPDAVIFDQSLDMVFERGPDHASQAWFESVAYYYLAEPARADSDIGRGMQRDVPRDPLAEMTPMIEILNFERLGDFAGADAATATHIETHPDSPWGPVWQLRRLAYREQAEGFDAVAPLYREFLQGTTNAPARQQAEDLLWFHEDTNHALLYVYCNTPARFFIDGDQVAQALHPERVTVTRLELTPGAHQFAIQAKWGSYPRWVQACLRTHSGDIITTRQWKHAYDPRGAWTTAQYDDSQWLPLGGKGIKGPPEPPYLRVEPNAFVNVQAQAEGLRPRDENWPNKQGFIVYRKKFEL
jgi:hypothetical protein